MTTHPKRSRPPLQWRIELITEMGDEMRRTIEATCELMPYLTRLRSAFEPGYFECALCGETQCGGGHTHTHEGAP